MHKESQVTSISWIPKYSIPGIQRIPFDIGLTSYDPAPPLEIEDTELLKERSEFRFANILRASVEIEDGRIISGKYLGECLMAETSVHMGVVDADMVPIEFPIIQQEIELDEQSARFVQTVGGHAGLPAPRFISQFPFIAFKSPIVWTTLGLTIYANDSNEFDLVGASEFPHHWIYDMENKLTAKISTPHFKKWWRKSFGPQTPWKNKVQNSIVSDVTLTKNISRHHTEISDELDAKIRALSKGHGNAILIYDGDCGFCATCVKFMRKRLNPISQIDFEIRTWKSIDDLSKYSLTEKNVNERVYLVLSSGYVLGGAAAMGKVGLHMKQPWRFFAQVSRLPVVDEISESLYRVIARNRHRLPSSTPTCAIEDRVEPQ